MVTNGVRYFVKSYSGYQFGQHADLAVPDDFGCLYDYYTSYKSIKREKFWLAVWTRDISLPPHATGGFPVIWRLL